MNMSETMRRDTEKTRMCNDGNMEVSGNYKTGIKKRG